MKWFRIAKIFIFVVLLWQSYLVMERVFLLKDEGFSKYINYQNLPSDSIDILYMGSSHPDAAINPTLIDGILGTSGFNYSISGLRIEHARFRLVDALKTQSPSLLVLDTFSMLPIEEVHREVLARWAFDSLPLSWNKVKAIRYTNPSDRASFYFPLIKYHSRWDELGMEDFAYRSQPQDMGFTGTHLTDSMEQIDNYFEYNLASIVELQPITPSQKESMDEIVKICSNRKIQILLVTVPYKQQLNMTSMDNAKINNYLRQAYVDEPDIRLLDLNQYWGQMNFTYLDLVNEGHTNLSGCEKTSLFLSSYLADNYTFWYTVYLTILQLLIAILLVLYCIMFINPMGGRNFKMYTIQHLPKQCDREQKMHCA